MRVLHVYKTALPTTYGGVESFIDTLCTHNSQQGISNTVLSLAPEPLSDQPIERNGYVIYQAKQHLFLASTGFSVTAFRLFRQLVERADLIHYHFPNPFADMLNFLCLPKKPKLLTYHSDIIKQKKLIYLYKPLMHCFLNAVDHIVATSPNYVATSPVLPHYSSKLSIIPAAIEPQRIMRCNKARLAYWKQRYSQPFFLFVGALRYYKGLHIALEAVKNTAIRLVIAGGQGEEMSLKAKAKSLQLNHVEFLGNVSEEDKVALMHACYGFIFPSHLRSEAFGLSLLECAVAGKPLISCEIGTGTSYINIANETGLVVTPNCAHALRDAMQYLLAHPEHAQAMGKKAQERVNTLFTVERQSLSYKTCYEALIFGNDDRAVSVSVD